MASIVQTFVAPSQFYSNASAAWFLGRKVSGMPAFEYGPNLAANTNRIVGFPIPWPVWDDGSGNPMELVQIKLHHFLSATSAGITPLISANWQLYEAYHRTGGVITGGMAATSAGSVVCPQLPDTTASAGFVDAAQASRTVAPGEPIQIDFGAGLRVNVPGAAGVLRVDLAHGIRDGATALTVGWLFASRMK